MEIHRSVDSPRWGFCTKGHVAPLLRRGTSPRKPHPTVESERRDASVGGSHQPWSMPHPPMSPCLTLVACGAVCCARMPPDALRALRAHCARRLRTTIHRTHQGHDHLRRCERCRRNEVRHTREDSACMHARAARPLSPTHHRPGGLRTAGAWWPRGVTPHD